MAPPAPGGPPPPPERPPPPRPRRQPAPLPPARPPAWGLPPSAQWPAWGTPIPPPPPPPPRRRAGWIVAGAAGLLVPALVPAVRVVRPGEQRAPARQAVGRRPSTTIAPDAATDLPRLL